MMDEKRRACHSSGRHGKTSTCLPCSSDTSFHPRHSTPVTKEYGGSPREASHVFMPSNSEVHRMTRGLAKSTEPLPTDSFCHPILQDTQVSVSGMNSAMIQRQRSELQLLIAELRDRDRELNSMAAFHQKQLLAWEQDRQRVLTLEQRCVRLDDELQKRNEVIRVLSKRVCFVEARERGVQKELIVTQEQLHKLEEKQQHTSQKCQDFEEKNQSLNSTVMALSSQVGSLQVREEELSAMLKLKDKDMTEANTRIVELTARLQDVETSLKESRSEESRLLKELKEKKQRYRETKHENTLLKEDLQQQIAQSSAQREDIIRLKQSHELLHRDLLLSGEGDSWKDELLALASSRHQRAESELRCLRQVCENQQNDLQLLQLNLESARESLREKSVQEPLCSQDLDNFLPSSLIERNSVPVNNIPTPPVASLQSTVSADLGFFSADLKDRLLDESGQVLASSERTVLKPPRSLQNSDTSLNKSQDSETIQPHHRCTCQTPPHPQTPQTHKLSQTPPKGSISEPRGQLDNDLDTHFSRGTS